MAVSIRRAKIERLWILISVLYGGVRTAIVWRYLRKYGVNPYFFGVIEFSTAAVYGLSSARLVGAVIDRNKRMMCSWSAIALVSFFAPDVFVFLSAGTMPASLVEILVSVVAFTTVVGVISLVIQLRQKRIIAN